MYRILRDTFDEFTMRARARLHDGREVDVRGTWAFAPDLTWYDETNRRWILPAEWEWEHGRPDNPVGQGSPDPDPSMGAYTKCPRGLRVQALRFRKDTWSNRKAREWAAAHGYPTTVDDKPTWNWMAIRVENPEHFIKDSFRWGEEWLDGLKPIFACPKKRFEDAPPRGTSKRERKVRPEIAKRKVAGAYGDLNIGQLSPEKPFTVVIFRPHPVWEETDKPFEVSDPLFKQLFVTNVEFPVSESGLVDAVTPEGISIRSKDDAIEYVKQKFPNHVYVY